MPAPASVLKSVTLKVFKVFVHVAGIKEPYSPDSELFNQREKQFESRQPICSSTYDFALLILGAHIAPFPGTKGVDAPQKEIFVNGNRVVRIRLVNVAKLPLHEPHQFPINGEIPTSTPHLGLIKSVSLPRYFEENSEETALMLPLVGMKG